MSTYGGSFGLQSDFLSASNLLNQLFCPKLFTLIPTRVRADGEGHKGKWGSKGNMKRMNKIALNKCFGFEQTIFTNEINPTKLFKSHSMYKCSNLHSQTC